MQLSPRKGNVPKHRAYLVAAAGQMEQISEQKRIKPLKIQLGNVTPANILQLKSINISTLPVRYTDKFYKDLIANGPHENLKFAFWNGFAVGAVCARIEVHDTVPDANKLYIMTINVLGPYRRRGIATALLRHVLDNASKDPSIVEAYLHVQTSNDDARQFYSSHGFEQTDMVLNYYKRIEPPHSFVLKKSLKEGHVVTSSPCYQKEDGSSTGAGNSDDLVESSDAIAVANEKES